MASYDYDIANLALARLGQGTITSLAAAGRDAEVCNLFYAQNRDYCLGLGNWISVTKRAQLTRAGKIAVTSIALASPAIVYCTGHLFISGNMVTVEDVVGTTEINGGFYIVSDYTSECLTVYNTDETAVDATAFTGYSSGGYVYLAQTSDWAFVYDLPSGCLKVHKVLDEDFGANDAYKWIRENDRLYTDVEYAGAVYTAQETDVTKYDEKMVELMAARLAWLISPRITNDQTKRQELNQEWLAIAGQVKMSNADDSLSNEPGEALWVNAR